MEPSPARALGTWCALNCALSFLQNPQKWVQKQIQKQICDVQANLAGAFFKEGERGFAMQCISRAFHAKQCISRVTVRKTLWIRKAVHFTCFRG
jgi:hypothetical protein